MYADRLRCWKCTWEGPLELRYRCPVCGGSLDVGYDYENVSREKVNDALEHFQDLWDFRWLLPVRDSSNIVTMHEGGTPLYRAEGKYGCRAYWKDETRNPTLSFKDRPNTVGISAAKEMGYKDVSIASTGNGGASLAAYAARGNMKCHICIPESTPEGKVLQAEYHGAEMVLCRGDYSGSYEENRKLSETNRWANLTSTYLNPFTMEGDKTIAYEIFAQLGRSVPDWIAVPLGAGAMLTGIYKGFQELKILGFCDRLPRMLGVQAEGCAPIIDAWICGADTVEAWDECQTLAGAIADPLKGYEDDGTRTLFTIRSSGGAAVKVSDAEIMNAVRKLSEEEGIFAEPASASVVAAIEKMTEIKVIESDERAVGIVTAHGLKDSEVLEQYRKGGTTDET